MYLYENLGDERFQQFCQTLLIAEFPDLQCFPVGQPDGGRDGFSRGGGEQGVSTVVQVKFRRKDEKESADWMIKALEKELPKIDRLVADGAERYIMATNASSSAHPRVGSHDRVQEWLDEHVSVPAEVYWRDELDRRLERAEPTVKLSYPTLLTGEDALLLIMAAQMGSNKKRITSTLRAFASAQFQKDEQVKFRQVDLTNSLLDLFVDVPVIVSELIYGADARRRPREAALALREFAEESFTDEQRIGGASELWGAPLVNTADALFDQRIQEFAPWIVLQGAPGQGKSTIAQYVCQVHRARFLGKERFVERIASRHANAPFRLPIKVDLRDYSDYLDGQEYLNVQNTDPVGVRSLERFLASLVSIQSGGRKFTVDDLAETASSTPMLLFLDGLDEVANIEHRRTLTGSILQALNRLRDDGVDVQVVITTRPSLFGRKLGLGSSFQKLELAPIGLSTVFAYCEKWMSARQLDDDRASEVRGILHQKLDQQHIRELTRNPMQLAILLNLIFSVGHSLPDERTALYREYVNLFMNRESEKTAAVRQHRAIISEIVEYLAWMLQAGAETDRGSGGIDEKALRAVVDSYLSRKEFDPAIAEEVFSQGIERVWVLVQRVEGRFEFEVQPLREYFAAKHLYATAPMIQYRHDEGGGDRSERFEAIAVNPYWSNVVRFYAGFYQPGEIPGLSRSLVELAESAEPAVRMVARNVAVELIADWIFALKKPIQNEVIALAFDAVGLNLAAADAGSYQTISLPAECGRDQLADILMTAITEGTAERGPFDLSPILAKNGGSTTTDRFVSWISAATGSERRRRLGTAIRSGALPDGDTVLELVEEDQPDVVERRKRTRVVCVGAPDLMDGSAALRDTVLEDILDGGGYRAFSAHPLAVVASALDGYRFTVRRAMASFAGELAPPEHIASDSVQAFTDWYTSQLETATFPMDSPADTDSIIEHARVAFGDRWAIYRHAAIRVGRYPVTKGRIDMARVDDPNVPLFQRAMLSRGYRGKSAWWEERISTGEPEEKLFWLAMLLNWASSAQVSDTLHVWGPAVDDLKPEANLRLLEAVQAGARQRRNRGGKTRKTIDASRLVSQRAATLLFAAFGRDQLNDLPERLRHSEEIEQALTRHAASEAWEQFPGWSAVTADTIPEWLAKLRAVRNVAVNGRIYHADSDPRFPRGVAEAILSASADYPRESGVLAYQSLMSHYTPRPVGDIAAEDAWALG